jgi:hypothetical protein
VSTEHELRSIASELRKIRQALERMSPPPEPEPKPESVYEKRRAIVL